MKKIKIILTSVISMLVLLSSCSATSSDVNSAATSTNSEISITTTIISTESAVSDSMTEKTIVETEESTTLIEAETTTVTEETAITTTMVAETTTTTVSTEEKTTTTTEKETTETEEAEMIPVEKKYIALTFDDGPNTTTTHEVLDVLEQYGIKGSFFLIGNNINSESEKAVKRAYDMGCDIGNHSKSHPYMNDLSVEEIKAEIDYVSEYIVKITGEEPKFFRPPYIAINNTMYDTIDLTFISGFGCNDWDDKVTAERRAKVIIRQAQDGGIILLHDAQGNSKTVEALHTIIPELQAQGYEFVTLTELFEIKGIKLSADDGNLYSFVGQ